MRIWILLMVTSLAQASTWQFTHPNCPSVGSFVINLKTQAVTVRSPDGELYSCRVTGFEHNGSEGGAEVYKFEIIGTFPVNELGASKMRLQVDKSPEGTQLSMYHKFKSGNESLYLDRIGGIQKTDGDCGGKLQNQ